jgi:putative ABC transport system substrate-binding protein
MSHGQRWSLSRSVALVALLHILAIGTGAGHPLKTIGILQMTPVLDASVEAFKHRLAALGYREGETIRYVYRNANGSEQKVREYAEELVAMPVDMLFTLTTAATTAAKAATAQRKIPIVFTAVLYPKEAALVEQLEHPGGWITGTSPLVLASKQLEILTQAVPHLRTLGVVYTEGDHPVALERLAEAAQARQLALHKAAVRQATDVAAAVADLIKTVDALYIPPDNIVTTELAAIIRLTLAEKIPVMVPTESAVRQGALLSYIADYQELAGFAADMAQKILHGENPADIPVEYPVKPKLTINLHTSRAIGLNIPTPLLFLADEVIE